MKNYTLHLLVIAVSSGLLGYSGLEFTGIVMLRILCLFATVALLISCLDAIIITRKDRKLNKKINSDR